MAVSRMSIIHISHTVYTLLIMLINTKWIKPKHDEMDTGKENLQVTAQILKIHFHNLIKKNNKSTIILR